MPKKPFLGLIEFTAKVIAAPCGSPGELCQEIEGVCWEFTDEDEDIQAGTLQFVLIRVQEAERLRYSLFDVFDEFSQELYELYRTLFDDEGDLRGDILGGMLLGDVLYIDEMTVERPETDVAIRMVETAGAFLVPTGLVTAYDDVLDLTRDELATLGFRHLGKFVYSERGGPIHPDSNGKSHVVD
ncbi:MAG: hypothetical protein RIC55_21450 [Pirellulaceae bacterium]